MFELIPALLFVLSSGLLFQERFRGNRFMVAFASAVALIASYFLFEQVVDRLAPTHAEAKQAAVVDSKPAIAATGSRYGVFADLDAVRAAINGLTENTTRERFAELFGPPAERFGIESKIHGHDGEISIERYAAGPYSLFVARDKEQVAGYGVARATSADAKGKTPLLFLSGGNGWNNLEDVTLGTVRGSCDPKLDGQEPGAFAPVPEGGTAMLVTSPKCNFGRPGGYADYAFVFSLGAAGSPDKACRKEAAQLDAPDAMQKITCQAMLDRAPDFVFMSKDVGVDVQQLAARVWGASQR